jgi:hypothetical protein
MAEVATVRIMPMDAANANAMIRLLCNAIVQPQCIKSHDSIVNKRC